MAWYHIPGNRQDTVIRTRVCLSRNLSEYPFVFRLDAPRAREIITRVGEILEKNGFERTEFADISRTAAHALVEKQYAGAAVTRESLPHAVFINEPCGLAVTVCEEDHIRLRGLQAGLAPEDAYEGVRKVEELLDASLPIAFDGQWGYLTPRPDRIGTALTADVLCSLPLLTEKGELSLWTRRLRQWGLTLSPVPDTKYLCRLLSLPVLGSSEREQLGRLSEAAQRLSEAEHRLRVSLAGEERARVEDRVRRAEGILRHASLLSAEELTVLAGELRLGAAAGMLEGIRIEALTALLFESLPATLSQSAQSPPKTPLACDALRASVAGHRLRESAE